MDIDQLDQQTEKGPVKWLALLLNTVSGTVLFALMLVTCVDVVGRYVFNKPLTGSTELTEMALAIVVFSVLPIISWRGEHVVVDILDSFTPPILGFIRTILFNVAATLALYYVGRRIIVLGNRSLGYGEVSEYLSIPTGWIINFIGGICWLSAFLLLTLGSYRVWKNYQSSKH